jgi:LysM repeat protein
MPPSSSRHLARFAAPAAFLLAVTIAVLLVRSGLGGGGSPPPATTAHTTTRAHTTPAVTTLPPITATGPATTSATTTTTTSTTTTPPVTTSVPGATYYTVQKGDTFTIIAGKARTTVAQIEQLNPGVSSNALTVGQQIRVK